MCFCCNSITPTYLITWVFLRFIILAYHFF
nr:MAG TPA: hypothetical protein [Caudoviricetes sp.]